jgi:hypothetical protein
MKWSICHGNFYGLIAENAQIEVLWGRKENLSNKNLRGSWRDLLEILI